MTEMSAAEQADYLSRRRARMLPLLAIIYLSQQVSYFSQTPGERAVDHVKIGAWVVLSLVLLAALTTKGFWFRPKAVRHMIDDETTQAHRSEAMGWGFVFSILSAIALYFIDQIEPMTARETIHIIVSLGLAAALVRFGLLERRAHRDA